MPRTALILILLAQPLLTGCALTDLAFALFGDAYSAGGDSDEARQLDYNSRVQAVSEPPKIPGADTRPY